MRQSLYTLLFALCLALTTGAQQPPSSEEAALRAVTLKYFETWAKKDLEGHMALWTGLEKDREARRQMLHNRMAEEDFSFSPPEIVRLQQRYGTAMLFVNTERRSANIKSQVATMTSVRLALTLVKEDEWRILRELPAPSAFMLELLAAGDAEQTGLLAEAKALVTPELLQMLVNQSDRAYAGGSYQQTLRVLRLLLAVAEQLNDRAAQAHAWHHLGITHFLLRAYKQAQTAHQQALALEQTLARKAETARVLGSLALTESMLNLPQAALAHYSQALALHEELKERSEMAQTLEAIGNLHYELGDYAKAQEHYRRSLDHLDVGKAPSSFANRLVKIARLAYEQGEDEVAIESYQHALDTLERGGVKTGRGFALHSLANVYYTQGDYGRALAYYQRSLQAEEETGNTAGIAGALQGIGLVHSLNGNYQHALPAYQRNLGIWQTQKDKTQLAAALQKVAGTRFALGEYQEALQLYQNTLKLREELGDQGELARAVLDVGITLANLNQLAEALQFDERSRALFAANNEPAGVASALLNIALVQYVQKDFDKALATADEAARFARQAEDNELLWQARHRSGKCLQRLNDLPAARQAFNEAVAILEAQRPSPGQGQPNRFNENKLAPYLGMVEVLLALNQGHEAFHYAERAKTRGMLTMLRGGRVWINKTMTPGEQERERQMLRELTRLNAQLVREYERQEPRKERLQDLVKRLRQARQSYDAFLQKLYLAHPRLKILRGEGKAVTTPEAALLVRDERTALLDFIETDERVFLFALTRQRAKAAPELKIYALGTNRSDLYARLTRLQTLLASRSAEADTALRELYDALLQPAQAQLAGKTRLVISPDGLLWNLPFAALQAASERYLIEDAALSLVPSLTTLQALARPASSRRTANSLLAFAAPELSAETLAVLKTGLLLDPNVSAAAKENEAAMVSKLFKAAQQRVLLGAQASEQNARTVAGAAQWLHFAAPAVLDEVNPFFSATALAAAPDVKGEDGLLTWREALQLNLNARLAVFSATTQMPARLHSGRAQAAALWTHFIAGCPAVLLNQWQSDEVGVSELLQGFYRQLLARTAQAPAPAWQAATRELLQRVEFRHPYYWAGFSLLGEAQR